MKFYLYFWDISQTETNHRTLVIEAESVQEAQQKVEVFCEVHFGFLFKD